MEKFKKNGANQNIDPDYIKMVGKVSDDLLGKYESNWIKVSDQLPPQGKIVLLYQTYPPGTAFNCRADPLPNNFNRLGGLRYDGLFIDYQNQYGEPLKYITHWMPLPKRPNEMD